MKNKTSNTTQSNTKILGQHKHTAFPPLISAPYSPWEPDAKPAELNDLVQVIEPDFFPEMVDLIIDSKCRFEDHPYIGNAPESWKASKRVSKKQLWFYAFRSKEITGVKFDCGDDYTGRTDYPTQFCVGKYPDGSLLMARCKENKINGPFWVSFNFRSIHMKNPA